MKDIRTMKTQDYVIAATSTAVPGCKKTDLRSVESSYPATTTITSYPRSGGQHGAVVRAKPAMSRPIPAYRIAVEGAWMMVKSGETVPERISALTGCYLEVVMAMIKLWSTLRDHPLVGEAVRTKSWSVVRYVEHLGIIDLSEFSVVTAERD